MKKQIVRFVVDKDLDIQNHLIGIWVYKNKLHALVPTQSERFEKLLKLSPVGRKRFVAEELKERYAPRQKKFLNVLAGEMNTEWGKMEKDFIRRIEQIHKKPFKFSRIRGVLSSADRFGYDMKQRWFATSMYRNTFSGTDTAMHELMHFMFHTYYEKSCRAKGLSEKETWDIKESFTVLLNLEFDDLRFNWESGYPEHKELRAVIKKSWLEFHDFDTALADAIKFMKEQRTI